MTVADRRERRGLHHAPDARAARRAQHAQRALARGHDQLVLVLGHVEREWRGHVQHEVATGRGFGPAGVGGEVGGEERQALAGVGARGLQHGAHLGLALERAHRGAHAVAGREQLQDAVRGDEARAAGDEDEFAAHGALRSMA